MIWALQLLPLITRGRHWQVQEGESPLAHWDYGAADCPRQSL